MELEMCKTRPSCQDEQVGRPKSLGVSEMSLPLLPSGKRTVEKGEVLKIGLYWMGSVDFDHAGRYYAIAEFSSAFAGDTNVRFTTKKRWFQVIDAKPKSI